MTGVPLKSTERNLVSSGMKLADALVSAGVYEAVEGESPFDPERMGAIARLMASEPGIPNLQMAARLGMSRGVIIRYSRRIRLLIAEGRLALEPFSGEAEELEGGRSDEVYNPAESIEATLRLIRGQKAKLERKQLSGKTVSTAQIVQLVNAEKAALSIPQRAEDVPKDFYDQVFGRVPVGEVVCPHCRRVIRGGEAYGSAEREQADYEELGAAGDLGADEIEEKEATDA